MSNMQIVMEAFWDECLKIAIVDAETGAFEIVKDINAPAENKLSSEKSGILDYFKGMAYMRLIHHEDFGRFFDIISEHMRDPASRHSSTRIRYKIGKDFTPCLLDIYPSKDENGKAKLVVCLSRVLLHDSAVSDAIETISSKIHKVLRIDLRDETYDTVKIDDHEDLPALDSSSKISDWFRAFADAHNVHPEDEDIYREFTDINTIKNALLDPCGKAGLRCRYRRRSGEDSAYRWAMMEIVRSAEYTSETPFIMLIVTDIHDSFSKDMSRLINLEHKNSYDELTGLKNMNSMNADAAAAERLENSRGIGILIADINGLTYTNDTFGHDAGDLLIKAFAGRISNAFGSHNCYRMSGDRIGLMLSNVDHDTFQRIISGFVIDIKREVPPPVAIGIAWGDYSTWGTGVMSVDALEKYAETMMNRDKEDIRLKYHRMRNKI